LIDQDLDTFEMAVLSIKFNWLHNSEGSTYTGNDTKIGLFCLKTVLKVFSCQLPVDKNIEVQF
jgi:hypothetical protein